MKYYPSECYLQYQNYSKQFICPQWGNSYVNPTLGKILCSYKNTYKDHEKHIISEILYFKNKAGCKDYVKWVCRIKEGKKQTYSQSLL